MTYDPFARVPHPVGVRTIAFSDGSRESRRIEVEIWYPTSAQYRGLDRDDSTCDRFTTAPGLGGRQQALREAEVTDGRFPMVLYSHAAASHRRDAALLGPHLASRGYIVAAPDHPGLDRLLDGADRFIACSMDPSRLGTCVISLGGWTTLRINSLDRRPNV